MQQMKNESGGEHSRELQKYSGAWFFVVRCRTNADKRNRGVTAYGVADGGIQFNTGERLISVASLKAKTVQVPHPHLFEIGLLIPARGRYVATGWPSQTRWRAEIRHRAG